MNTQKDKIRAAAQKYLQKGQIDKAIREFERLVEDDPSDVRTLLKIGDLHARMDNTPAAVKTYTSVAEHYAEQGFFLKAIAVYKQVAGLTPDDVTICRKLAETYVLLGLVPDAINQFRQLCNLCESQGLWEDCIKAAEGLVSLDGANIAGRIKLAEMQARAGHVDDAIDGFRKAARELEQANRHEEWAKVLERVIQLAPTDAESCQALAGYYLNHEDPKRALSKLQIAFKVNAQDPATLSLLAEVFEALEQPQKAMSALRELAMQQRTLHDHVGWEKTLRHILRLSPDDAEARELLGAQLTEAARKQALSQEAEIMAAEPMEDDDAILQSEIIDADEILDADELSAAADDDPIVKMLTEADIYIKYGLRDKAIEHLDRVLLAHPDHREAQARYRKLLEATGDVAGAQARLLQMAKQAQTIGAIDMARSDVAELLAIEPQHAEGLALRQLLERAGDASTQAADDLAVEIDVDIDIEMEFEPASAEASNQTTTAPDLDIELVAEPAPQPVAASAATEVEEDSGFGAEPTQFVKAPAFERPKTPVKPPPAAPVPELGPMNLGFEPSSRAAGFDLDDGEENIAPQAGDTQAGDFTNTVTQIDNAFRIVTALKAAPAMVPPAPPVQPVGAQASQTLQAPAEMMAELYEVRFFVKQGLFSEARDALAVLARSHPSNTEIRAYNKEIDQAQRAADDAREDAAPKFGPSAPDLADELADLSQALAKGDVDINSAFDNVFDEFSSHEAAAAPQSEDDGREVATHFDLGIAYKEMGMLAEAIAEFEHTTPFEQYEVNACTMLGLCHLEMGHTEEALIAFRRGLGSPQITPQEATALRYEVGLAYESMGQIVDALKFYEKTHEMDPSFRDVAQRLSDAKLAASDSQEASSSDLDVLLDDSQPQRTDNKVSFF